METRIVKIAGKNKIQFSQGFQTFTLDYNGTIKNCKWVKKMLNKAFDNFKKEILMQNKKMNIQ